MRPVFGPTSIEDPTIARVCALEYDRLWQRIGAKVAGGAWFYGAREQVLAEEMLDIQTAYGKVVADRVARAIQHTSPDRLPKAVKEVQRDRVASLIQDSRPNMGWINRLFLRWTGMPLT